MYDKNKQILILVNIFAVMALGLLIIGNTNIIIDDTIETPISEEKLKPSGYWTESYIDIDDSNPTKDWAWMATNEPWCYGSGEWSNPYVIFNVSINAAGSPTGSGIIVSNSVDVYFIIRNCTVYNGGTTSYDGGIKLYNTNNGTIEDNDFSNNGWVGIMVYSSNNNTIRGNTANNNNNGGGYGHGICLAQNSDNNTIDNNDFHNNEDDGISFTGGDYNEIFENIIDNNAGYGVYFSSDSDHNEIFNNNITNNNGYGVNVGYSGAPNGYNNITQNNFINNGGSSSQGYDYTSNGYWDNGNLGNYWDDYGGSDGDGDGIGDSPYQIDPGPGTYAKDDRPLMQPFEYYMYDLSELHVDDDYDSGTQGWQITHFDTIQGAINKAPPGSGDSERTRIFVHEGTYNENVHLNKPLDLIGLDREKVIINGSGVDIALSIEVPECFVENFTILNKDAFITYYTGIRIGSVGNNTIVNCTIYACSTGIDIDGGTSWNTEVLGCLIYNTSFGINVANSPNVNISHNVIHHNTRGINLLYADNCNVEHNYIYNNTQYHILGRYCNGLIIQQNSFYYGDNDGIRLEDSPGFYIVENNITGSGNKGVWIYDTNSFYILKNNITENGQGIYFDQCLSSGKYIFYNNISFNNGDGINIASTNAYFGIAYNYFQNNTGRAIYMNGDWCRIYLNDFIGNNGGNDNQVLQWIEASGNEWYNSSLQLGNFWNNASSIDSNGDGINDYPRPIPSAGGNKDQYPLMYSFIYYDFKNIYVDDDFNSGTPGWNVTRFDTIQKGVNKCDYNGGTVWVLNGTYQENIVVSTGIAIIGEDKDLVTVDGGGLGTVIYIDSVTCYIQGLTIINSGPSGSIAAGILIDLANPTIEQCNITYNDYGIWSNGSNAHIVNNYIMNNTADGIFLDRSNWNTIRENYVKYNQRDGLSLVGDWASNGRQNQIISNWFYMNNRFGINLSRDTFDNNITLNRMYWNNGMTMNAYDDTLPFIGNTWDSLNPDWGTNVGNYWTDYFGPDADRNGIGDDPFPIPIGISVDNAPLIVDFANPEVVILTPANLSNHNTEPEVQVQIWDDRTFIDKMWYYTNFTGPNFFTDNDSINFDWSSYSDGQYIEVRFYANDTWGNVNSSET